MTTRQIFLKLVYPLIMLRNKLMPHKKSIQLNKKHIEAPVSFHSLTAKANNGSAINFDSFRGKKVLIANTASDCGFTAQYAELEKLHKKFRNELVILGFPANDFKNQEQLDDKAIAGFCQINFGVSFPLAQKSQVINGGEQNPVFEWLTHTGRNGWCNQQPLWNFSKYLIDEEGNLVGFFAHTVSPLNKKITSLI